MAKDYTNQQIAKAITKGLYHLEHSCTERSMTDQMHYADTCVGLEEIVAVLEAEPKVMRIHKNPMPPTIPEGVYTDEFGNRVEIKWAAFDQEKYESILMKKALEGGGDVDE